MTKFKWYGKEYPLPIVILFFMVMMLIFPAHYLDSTRKGLTLFAASVLPAIFPFMFLSTLLSKTGIVGDVSRVFGKVISRIFGGSEHGAYVLFSALISGYPVGAVTTSMLYEKSVISTTEAKRMVSFTSLASPIFLLGTLGGILGDTKSAVIVMISHYLASLINGLLWKGIYNRKDTDATTTAKALAFDSADNAIGEAVTSATLSMLVVGGYIVLMGLVVDTVALLPFVTSSPAWARGLLYGMIEMTRGCVTASEIDFTPLKVAIATLAVTFGGISVNLQSYHYLSRCGLTLKEVVLPKISGGIFAFFIALIFSILFFNILA